MLLRALHVLGAVLLLGNVVVTGAWSVLLVRGGAPRALVARGIIVTDWLFTLGGAALLITTGVWRAIALRLPLWDTPFIRHGLLALGVATLLWLAVLVPLQRQMSRARDDAEFARAFRRWTIVGWLDVLPLAYALWAMTTRPA